MKVRGNSDLAAESGFSTPQGRVLPIPGNMVAQPQPYLVSGLHGQLGRTRWGRLSLIAVVASVIGVDTTLKVAALAAGNGIGVGVTVDTPTTVLRRLQPDHRLPRRRDQRRHSPRAVSAWLGDAGMTKHDHIRRSVALIAVIAAMATLSAIAAARTEVRTLPLGSTFTVTGLTGSLPGHSVRATGLVVVVKSWDGGEHRLITTARTDSHGHYRVAIKLTRRGLLSLRIVPPDKHVLLYLIRVV